jgi:tetratricopeptide (TPR) repeat protein
MTKQEEWKGLMRQVQNFYGKGKYAPGINKGEAALKLAEGLSKTNLALTLNELALLYVAQGLYEKAEPRYLRALTILEKKLGADHPDVATTLNNLAGLYQVQGLYEKAEPHYVRALAILEKKLGADHPSVANSLNNLAVLYQVQGLYEQAKPQYLRALAIEEKSLGVYHPSVATTLDNLAVLYQEQGLYEQAEPQHLRALAIKEKSLGTYHPSVAATLDNLAGLYQEQGLYEQAEPHYLRALTISEKKLGADHPDVAITLNNLAALYESRGLYEQAEPRYLRALTIKEKKLGADHPSVATTLDNLAGLYQEQGLYEQAEPQYLRALAIKEKKLGADHPDVAITLNNLATLYESQGLYEQALQRFETSLTHQYNFLRNRLAHIQEQEHQLYLKNIKLTLELILSLVYQYLDRDPKAILIALQSTLLTKALSATALATRNALIHSDRYPQLHPKLKQLQQSIDLSNNLDYSDPARAAVLSQIREIEIEIAKAAPDIMLPEVQTVDRQAIALKLPTDSTLVEFVRFNLYDFDNKSSGEAKYFAFTLPKDQPDEIQMVDLGNAEEIDDLVEICRAAIIQDFDEDFPNKAKVTIPTEPAPADLPPRPIPVILQESAIAELHERLIAPLQAHLHSQKLVIAPEGNLCHLPFNILLPTAIVSYLTTGRDLVRNQSSKPASKSLVIADPDFRSNSVSADSSIPTVSQQLAKASAGNLLFTPLPSFGILGRSIARKLNAREYYQASASKDAIVNGSCPHILSILTHGFALPATETETDPMARSGLAFSGANLNKNNLLLANEVATLDLHSNDLTILVACETALGDIKHGEGVYGLRRAFTLAGAKTLIATLWSIPVLASVVLVERFFDNLQIRQMAKGAALIEAQTYLRTRTQADLQASRSGMDALAELTAANYDLAGVDCPFAHPYFWAAWVCQGETGQMEYTTTKAVGEFNIGGKMVNLRLKQ